MLSSKQNYKKCQSYKRKKNKDKEEEEKSDIR